MNFNIYNGTSEQEIALMKKVLKNTDAAIKDITDDIEDINESIEDINNDIDQLESEVATKRGHWYKYGSDVTAAGGGAKAIQFDHKVSQFAIFNTSADNTKQIGVAVFTLSPQTVVAGGAMVFSDGLKYGHADQTPSVFNVKEYITNGGYTDATIYGSVGDIPFDIYVID